MECEALRNKVIGSRESVAVSGLWWLPGEGELSFWSFRHLRPNARPHKGLLVHPGELFVLLLCNSSTQLSRNL